MTDDLVVVAIRCPRTGCRSLEQHSVIDGRPNGNPKSADISAMCSRCGWPFDARITVEEGEMFKTKVEYLT